MATVAWWQEDPPGCLSAWLVVGPGPAPLSEQAWVHQLAIARPPAGGWAVVDQPALGPLPEPLAARLRDPEGEPGVLHSTVIGADGQPTGGAAPDDLYLDCLDAATALVAQRLAEDVVVSEPQSSGVLLARLRVEQEDAVLDLGPALDEEGWQRRSIGVDLDGLRLGTRGDGRPPQWMEAEPREVEFGTARVELGGSALALPCASLRWPLPGGRDVLAALEVTLPSTSLPGVPEPRVRLTLEAPG
jgi:hypothetical protein